MTLWSTSEDRIGTPRRSDAIAAPIFEIHSKSDMKTAAENKNLEIALAIAKRSSGGVKELANTIWPRAQVTSIWWDNYYRAFVTNKCQDTCRALFGSHRTIRSILNHGARNTIRALCSPQRWSGPFYLESPLPRDAVLFPINPNKAGASGHSKNRIVVASCHSGTVLKLSYDRGEVEKEIENWAVVESAGIESHVPRLMDYGETNDGGKWMLTQLAPNTQPFRRPLNPFIEQQALWRYWLRWKILPTMERFH